MLILLLNNIHTSMCMHRRHDTLTFSGGKVRKLLQDTSGGDNNTTITSAAQGLLDKMDAMYKIDSEKEQEKMKRREERREENIDKAIDFTSDKIVDIIQGMR